VGNENYVQPAMPEGVEQGILRGIYRFKAAEGGAAEVHLFGSGSILNEALRAQTILAGRFGVRADVWSVTSYNELRRRWPWIAGTGCTRPIPRACRISWRRWGTPAGRSWRRQIT
jgi:pyruvate dehydrogenase complex dehydrogenase (E1) component